MNTLASPPLLATSTGPLRSATDVASASAEVLVEQIRFELRHLMGTLDITQTVFAQRIAYGEGTVSRWKSGRQSLSDGGAKSIDKNWGPTTLGISFQELLRAYRAARRTIEHDWDVFLSAPMAATGSSEGYARVGHTARAFSAAIESDCEWSVFFAGNGIPTMTDFDGADLALEINCNALRGSRFFVMIVLEQTQRPSSVFVEAGFALALNKPSLYFCADRALLPYVLREAPQHSDRSGLPPVRIYEVDDLAQAVGLVKRHKSDLFQ